ncbi:MAG: mercury(II) reductase [Chloroflexi bacterium]|nr:mercury(II) reductase [Chloroflexota bacterium]
MTCTGCELHVVRALERAGATEVKADFRRDEASFQAPVSVAPEALAEAVEAAGYQPGPVAAVAPTVPEHEFRMAVDGMTCAGCEAHVVEALERTGATRAHADFRRGEARFRASAPVDVNLLAAAVTDAGYQPGPVEALRPEREVTRRTTGGGTDYDLAIVGSGGAAFAAAIKASEAGARVVMIERGTLGGTCVNIGCVPSKTLLRAGELHFQAGHHPFAGIETRAGAVDLAALVAQKDELVRQLRREKYADLIEDYGWDVVSGEASFVDERTLRVDGDAIRARSFLLATGASPAVPPIPGLDQTPYLTSTSALDLQRVPESLVIVGSGYIALELGQLFRHLGSRVTLMQRSPRILREYDPEISEAVHEVMTEQGIEFVTGARFERVEGGAAGRRVHVEVGGEKRVVEGEELLVAAGRRPNTAALRLDRAGVRLGERGEIAIDEYARTTNPRVFAAGDVTLGPQFVYVAAYEGALAAENAIDDPANGDPANGAGRRIDLRVVPAVTFTNPAIATVGLTEAQARGAGYSVKTSVLPAKAVPRALVNRDTHGVFKIVADEATDRILGVHVVAENAGDVIYAGVLAVKFNLTVQDLVETLAPYLTMAEGLKLAAQTFGKDVARLSCCAS